MFLKGNKMKRSRYLLFDWAIADLNTSREPGTLYQPRCFFSLVHPEDMEREAELKGSENYFLFSGENHPQRDSDWLSLWSWTFVILMAANIRCNCVESFMLRANKWEDASNAACETFQQKIRNQQATFVLSQTTAFNHKATICSFC